MSRRNSEWEVAWQFDTPRFRVTLEVTNEDEAPDFDDDGETLAAIESGRVVWFVAAVVVYFGEDEENLVEIARDVLGGCAYNSVREFYTSHRDPDPMNRNCTTMRANHPSGPKVCICHYFPRMVSEAIATARHAIANAPAMLGRELGRSAALAATLRQ